MNFKKVKISNIGEVISGGTPSTKNEEYWNGDVSWITPKDLSGHEFRRICRGSRNITELGLQKSSAKLLPKNSIIYTTRAPIGYIAIADCALATNQGFKNLIINDDYDLNYVFYLLKYNREQVESRASGSTFKEISATSFRNLEFSVPSLDDQKSISQVLTRIDDKIELNINLNSKIETLLTSIYYELFIESNPDKVLDFIDKFLNEELNKEAVKDILCDHSYGTISDLGEIVGGGTPSTKNSSFFCSSNKGVPWVSPKDLSGHNWKYISHGAINITEEGYKRSGARKLPKGTILFSSRAPIGYVAIACNEVSTNQGFKSLVPTKEYGSNFLYYFIKSYTPSIASRASGSTFKEISGSALKNVPVKLPSHKLSNIFEEFASQFSDQQYYLYKENYQLIKFRDQIALKLLRGEFCYKKVEKINGITMPSQQL